MTTGCLGSDEARRALGRAQRSVSEECSKRDFAAELPVGADRGRAGPLTGSWAPQAQRVGPLRLIMVVVQPVLGALGVRLSLAPGTVIRRFSQALGKATGVTGVFVPR
jgi:hypothetical protein